MFLLLAPGCLELLPSANLLWREMGMAGRCMWNRTKLCACKGFQSVTFSRNERLWVLLPSLCTYGNKNIYCSGSVGVLTFPAELHDNCILHWVGPCGLLTVNSAVTVKHMCSRTDTTGPPAICLLKGLGWEWPGVPGMCCIISPGSSFHCCWEPFRKEDKVSNLSCSLSSQTSVKYFRLGRHNSNMLTVSMLTQNSAKPEGITPKLAEAESSLGITSLPSTPWNTHWPPLFPSHQAVAM